MPKDKKPFDVCVTDEIPPCLVRAMAMCDRVNGGKRLMTNEEISKQGKLSHRTVQRISASTSWAGIKADAIVRFLDGCGVNPRDQAWLQDWVTRYCDTDFPHITDGRLRKQLFKLMCWK